MLEDRYDRQSFLGKDSQNQISNCNVGIIGLGGGGSHIVQQLSHIGFQNFVIYDPDIPDIEGTNLNRLINLTKKDVMGQIPKVQIAKRTILGLQEDAKVLTIQKRWQDEPSPLINCDLIFGCVDGYQERYELEIFSRRYIIPYFDIGIDVNHVKPQPPYLSGQIIVSIPGGPCMHCIGFLTEKKLSVEAQKYGDVGGNPQVVWANGTIASTAVGIAVDMITGWTNSSPDVVYLMYDGNLGLLKPHTRLNHVVRPCPHYPADQVGEAIFMTL